ncbi:MAG: type polyketide synthase [Segetibacter sp.]|nr:type polyketide synthase [Segetibacter sp.]
MANIISIGTALPEYCHQQNDILKFMQKAYKLGEGESRKLAFLYRQSEIQKRYSVINDFATPESDWQFLKPCNCSPSLDERMKLFQPEALSLSVASIENCIEGIIDANRITHLITVSCTGMSAPGLDLQIAETLQLPSNIFRTSVNFMGCYAAIHALKIAKMICHSSTKANVMIVCTELCTIHFQQNFTHDNAASSLLFGDGSAAVLVSNTLSSTTALTLKSFYSEVSYKGKEDMSWQLSNHGFLMKLSSYIPQFIEEDIAALVTKALEESNLQQDEITHWCIHPGGKKILEVIQSQLSLNTEDMSCSRSVLSNYGNMSSPTILFVLKEIMEGLQTGPANVFGVAFGPGLTMETFIAAKG